MATAAPPALLIDLLAERLAFERRLVGLYDGLLSRVAGRAAGETGPSAEETDRLSAFRDDERRHVVMLTRCLRRLGTDPSTPNAAAEAVSTQTAGLAQAMADPRIGMRQALRLLLDAELLDNAGWDLLCEAARSCAMDAFVDPFEQALRRQNEHLDMVRDLVARVTLRDTLAREPVG